MRILLYFCLIVALPFGFAVNISAQQPPEPWQMKMLEAAGKMNDGDYDAAIVLYSEALDLFPKDSAFVPKVRILTKYEKNVEPQEYRGLNGLYLARFGAYLAKGDEYRAQMDFNSNLRVRKMYSERRLSRANELRAEVRLENERRLEQPNHTNSKLIKAAALFTDATTNCLQTLSESRYEWLKGVRGQVPERFVKDPEASQLLDKISKICEVAGIGNVEARVYSAIDVQNRSMRFSALQASNELVFRYPTNAHALRLRARIAREWGLVEQALSDELKANELR
jgi:tetratricopeptide (TPR) repeat protein